MLDTLNCDLGCGTASVTTQNHASTAYCLPCVLRVSLTIYTLVTTQSYQSALRKDIQVTFLRPSLMASPFNQQCDIQHQCIVLNCLILVIKYVIDFKHIYYFWHYCNPVQNKKLQTFYLILSTQCNNSPSGASLSFIINLYYHCYLLLSKHTLVLEIMAQKIDMYMYDVSALRDKMVALTFFHC